jgi:hypothetical protein
MLPLLIATARTVAASPIAAACLSWSGKLIARLVARQLQVPEALVHDAGRYIYAQIDSFERRLKHDLLSGSRYPG